MVEGIADTSVFVDFIRGLPEAIEWLKPSTDVGVTPIIWLELLEGIGLDGPKNREKLDSLTQLLNSYVLMNTTADDVLWARDKMISYRLTHDIDPFDFLIASTAYRLQIPLYTKNLKHFRPILGDLTVKPY